MMLKMLSGLILALLQVFVVSLLVDVCWFFFGFFRQPLCSAGIDSLRLCVYLLIKGVFRMFPAHRAVLGFVGF